MPSVFIVRPFGNNRPVIKKKNDGAPEIVFFDFDKVESDLILPAMTATDLVGGTTQRIFQSGEIKEDMFSQLLLADVVIADITIHNANVFYELGIRHALRQKTTILIKCVGFDETPFDIIGYKFINYQKDNPAEALSTLIQFITDSPESSRKDSPVFNMLPGLSEQDTEKFLAVPEEFGEEVTIATSAGMIGKLKLLMNEAAGFPWEIQADRFIGESFFRLKVLHDGRVLWEKVKKKNRNDMQANDRLSTIYQRLAEIEMSVNPTRAKALLAQSDLANDIILKNYANLDMWKRAEVYALKGRNAKSRWINEWQGSPVVKKELDALQSANLEAAYENYESGYYENLNHFYSGINALGLLTITITLAKRYPDQWQLIHDEEDEDWKISRLESKHKKLLVSLQFSLEAEKRRLNALKKKDLWFKITEADFTFLTSSEPAKVKISYSRALTGAENFHIESVEKQLNLYGELNVLTQNVEAAQAALPPKNSTWEKTHYLLFTGHMIDKPERKEPRFPASKENAVTVKIAQKVKEALDSLAEGTTLLGIAGGACGGDIIFHEVCLELNIKTQLFLAMPREDYIVESVAFAGPAWISRFDKLYKNANIPHFELSEKKELPKWLKRKPEYDVWKRNNLWSLHSAMVNGGMNMTLVALWDGKGGDGPGGTEHMVREANERGARTLEINMNDI